MRKVISFLIGVIVFSGLPLLGWGLNNIDGFIHNPFRLTFIIMMTILSVFVVIFVPNEGRGQGEGKETVKRQKLTILFLQIIPLALVISSPFFDHYSIVVFEESSIIRSGGVILSFIGFFLMNWSVIFLDKQFSIEVTIQDNHKLVTNGPYRYIRHPRYLGIILFLSGISLVFLSLIALILVLITIIVLLWRIRDEEKLMFREFKEAWEDYKKKTFSLIPFIY
jgi:protein-S-isoprenylcysteine O-methyltransferase Ste14